MKKSNPILIGTFLVVLICALIYMQSQSDAPAMADPHAGHDHAEGEEEKTGIVQPGPSTTAATQVPSIDEMKSRLKSNVPKAAPEQTVQPDNSGTDPNSSVIPRGRWWETQKR